MIEIDKQAERLLNVLNNGGVDMMADWHDG